jgi:nucleotide-binding universal stress UspA family protein
MIRCPLGEHSVVVGVDRTVGAERALAWAKVEAERTGRGLWLVHVWAWGEHAARTAARLDDPVEDGRRLLNELAQPLRDAGRPVAVSLLDGRASEVLVEAADACELLVLGPDHRGRFGRVVEGSVAMGCLRRASRPVAIVGEPTGDGDATRITVGVDGSEGGQRALQWAAGEAATRGDVLRVVHVWDRPGGLWWTDSEEERAARTLLDEAVETVSGRGVEVERRLHQGRPIEGLLLEARGSELLVVGSHGRSGLLSVFLGSVSAGCVHRSGRPVVVVPPARRAPQPEEPATL